MRVYYSFTCFLILCLTTIITLNHANSKPDIGLNYQFQIAVPEEFNLGSSGKAFLIDTNYQIEPNFRLALSVDQAIDHHGIGKYSCSLQVFLGDVKVWSSGHYSTFFVSDKCVIELTSDGDLTLKGPKGRVGWRTGTSGQGVERLHILKTGNLVLLDGLDRIKWQSFNFPTDVMLWGQRLNVATRLTSFPSNTTSYYSLEIEHTKIALYLNTGKTNYSYWEFKPSKSRNITFIELSSKGLGLFNEKGKKIAQITTSFDPLRFLALGNKSGNLGLYHYSPSTKQFEASFQALNATCDLPLACQPFGICTFSNSCSCIHMGGQGSDCAGGVGPTESFCARGNGHVEMLNLEDVSSVLSGVNPKSGVNVSKEECGRLCLEDCQCASASFSKLSNGSMGCSLYGIVGGLREVDRGSGVSFMVKVSMGVSGAHGRSSNVKRWVLVLVGVVDGIVILVVLGGLGYYLIRKRRRGLLLQEGSHDN